MGTLQSVTHAAHTALVNVFPLQSAQNTNNKQKSLFRMAVMPKAGEKADLPVPKE